MSRASAGTGSLVPVAAGRQALGLGRQYPFVIEVEQQVAGTLTVFVAPGRDHAVEIGYLIGSRFEGRGIVTRSVAAVIDAAIRRLGVHRFEIRCAPENVASCAVPRRLGFTEEGLSRDSAKLSGRYLDELVHALLSDEWQAR